MAEKSKKPRLRFRGFTETWEQRKLGEILNVTSVKRIHQSDWTSSGVRFLRARDIVADFKKEELSDFLYISEEKYNEYSALSGKVKVGDLLVTGVGTIGVPMLINDEKPIYFKDGNIIWFQNAQKIDGNFFYYSFVGNAIQSFIQESAGTGTVGTYTIESGKKTPISLPKKFEEQLYIGSFFKNIDNLITLHQRKYDKFVAIKKALLEKMFPRAGKNVPEIRFKGFTETWEQRELSKICSMHARIGWQNLRTSEFLDSGDYYLITGTDFVDGRVDLSTCHYVDKARFEQDKKIQLSNGSILITKDGTLGKVAIIEDLDKPATLNAGVFNVEILSDSVDNLYLYQYLRAPFLMDYVDKKSTGGTIKHLNQNILVSFPVLLPTYPEQCLLGRLFQKIDNLITLHQRQLERLKNIKAALLEKMFV